MLCFVSQANQKEKRPRVRKVFSLRRKSFWSFQLGNRIPKLALFSRCSGQTGSEGSYFKQKSCPRKLEVQIINWDFKRFKMWLKVFLPTGKLDLIECFNNGGLAKKFLHSDLVL